MSDITKPTRWEIDLGAVTDELSIARSAVAEHFRLALDDQAGEQAFVQVAAALLTAQSRGRTLHALKLLPLQERLGIYAFVDARERISLHCLHNAQTFEFTDMHAAQREARRPGSAFARWIDAGPGVYLRGHEDEAGIKRRAQENVALYLCELYARLIAMTASELERVHQQAMEPLARPPTINRVDKR